MVNVHRRIAALGHGGDGQIVAACRAIAPGPNAAYAGAPGPGNGDLAALDFQGLRGAGQRLADGFGFTEEVIWQYLDNPGQLPVPSHSYWMPLPSIMAAGGYLISDSFRISYTQRHNLLSIHI